MGNLTYSTILRFTEDNFFLSNKRFQILIPNKAYKSIVKLKPAEKKKQNKNYRENQEQYYYFLSALNNLV